MADEVKGARRAAGAPGLDGVERALAFIGRFDVRLEA